MISNSPEETKKVAHDFASTISGGDVVFLEGDLGSGKTTFVQGILEAFGYTEPVRSPTFSIMNMYPVTHPTIARVIHLDFYRFESPEEIQPLGLEELFEDKQNIFLIEWPEKALNTNSKFSWTHRIQFQSMDTQKRQIDFTPLLQPRGEFPQRS